MLTLEILEADNNAYSKMFFVVKLTKTQLPVEAKKFTSVTFKQLNTRFLRKKVFSCLINFYIY